jgi:glycosyltransferase involved in cell wall biosynthesis
VRILLLMDPFIPVPPTHYGGIERVVYDIACAYKKMGHSVTIIAGPGSVSPERLIVYGYNAGKSSTKLNLTLLFSLSKILWKEIKSHDVIHNFGRLAWLFPIAWSDIRKVHTYMRYITPSNINWLNRIKVQNIMYTGVSHAIVKTGIEGGGSWKVVYNCASIEKFNFQPIVIPDAPLVFLGRLERCKGVHTAIAVAMATNHKLIIAGNISDIEEEQEYFRKEIQPKINGTSIIYIGPVDNQQKNSLLGNAKALLLPIEWFEPFPVVLPEAYACGTPVLAFPGGGMEEGVFHGKTGFLCHSIEDMIERVESIKKISRYDCRKVAEELYSDKKIASDYLNLYQD